MPWKLHFKWSKARNNNILRNIWSMWPSVWPLKAPGRLLVWKGRSVTQVILILGLCESSWCVFSSVFPCHPLVAKPWDERRNQYKLKEGHVCPPHPPPLAHTAFASYMSSLADRLQESGEAACRGCSHPLRMAFQKLGGAVAVLKPMLILTHYMSNLPQISVIKMSML